MADRPIGLLVISDSHGRGDLVREAAALHRGAEALLFLGDGVRDLEYVTPVPTRALCAVRGNCDWHIPRDAAVEFPTERCLVFGEYRIFMMHGHTHGVKHGTDAAIRAAAERGADVLLYGHTHIPEERYIPAGETVDGYTLTRPMYVFNPGSLGESRTGGHSFGYIEIRGKMILMSHGTL